MIAQTRWVCRAAGLVAWTAALACCPGCALDGDVLRAQMQSETASDGGTQGGSTTSASGGSTGGGSTGALSSTGSGSTGGGSSSSTSTTTSDGSSTGGGSTDGGSTGGVQPDSCTGLDQATCSQLGNCEPIWGTPYTEVPNQPGDWCLFSNGLEYLGCREVAACPSAPNGVIICDGQSWWEIEVDCLPAEIDVDFCNPPGNVTGPC